VKVRDMKKTLYPRELRLTEEVDGKAQFLLRTVQSCEGYTKSEGTPFRGRWGLWVRMLRIVFGTGLVLKNNFGKQNEQEIGVGLFHLAFKSFGHLREF